jgi:hypothetical protein
MVKRLKRIIKIITLKNIWIINTNRQITYLAAQAELAGLQINLYLEQPMEILL